MNPKSNTISSKLKILKKLIPVMKPILPVVKVTVFFLGCHPYQLLWKRAKNVFTDTYMYHVHTLLIPAYFHMSLDLYTFDLYTLDLYSLSL